MKKLIFGIFFIGLLAFILLKTNLKFSDPVPEIPPLPSPAASPSLLINTLPQIVFQNQVYHYSFVKITQPINLLLFVNQQKLSSQDLIDKHQCQVLVNGGFYGQDNQPIGWLISNYQLVSDPVKSQLLNSYFSLKDQPIITASRPSDNPRIGLQSGPLLIYDQKPLKLNIKNDEPRRRLILSLNQQNQIIFLVITGEDSLFTGPLLSDTPALTAQISQQIGENLVSALNLDGGSASVFYTPDIYIKEYSWVGSFFCLK